MLAGPAYVPFEGSVAGELVCLGCDRVPVVERIVWSDYLHRGIHTADKGHAGPLDRICGGVVVRKEDAWDARLAPGELVLAVPGSIVRSTMHYVRLGHLAGKGGSSWRGTALCGAVPRKPNWLPVRDPESSGFPTCAKCRKLHRDAAR